MLLRYRIHFLAAILAVFLLASCGSKTNKEGKFIPKKAALVMHINGASLNSKLPWDEIKANAAFQQMYADSSIPAFARKIMDNPENSGIDIKTDMMIFAQKDSLGGWVAFTGTVKDVEKFRLFNLEITGGGSETKEGDNSYISKAPVCIGWNKDRFVYIVDAPQLNPQLYYRRFLDTSRAQQSRDIGATCRSIFALKEDNSLSNDERFSELMKQEGDIHFWVNSEELQKGMANNEELPMMKLDKLYEGSVTTATINFENGKIAIGAKSYAGKELKELYKKYSGNNINEDMIKRLPAKDIAGVFALNFKPEGINELLKLMGMDAMANIGLSYLGFTMDDFIKANKGDIVLAVSDFKIKTDSVSRYDYPSGKEEKSLDTSFAPDVLFAAAIADKASFNQLIKAGEKFGKGKDMKMPVSYTSNDKYFAIGNSKESVEKYVAGGSDSKYDFLSKISGGPMGGYINIQYIMKALHREVYTEDSSDVEVYNASLKMWDNAYLKGGNYSDGGITQTIEINLVDKTTNSLKQLNQYFGKIAQIMESKAKKYESQYNYTVPPPMVDSAVVTSPKKH
jgi:hypothetical protein